ncbi:ATP-binding protein [Chloroflexota bacterium]
MAIESGKLTPKPYARLLSMLSEQLIKNNTVALTEIAKNSYDADASWVQIRVGNMGNFGIKNLTEKEKPFVEIEDDGEGMSFDTIRDSWMNPATPDKYLRDNKVTKKGRTIQGEKGIGRYAVHKIGKRVELYSRKRIGDNDGEKEVCLITDLSKYTKELISEKGKDSTKEPLYLDQVTSDYRIPDKPKYIKPGKKGSNGGIIDKKNHGTLIRITELNQQITEPEIRKIKKVLQRLESPFRQETSIAEDFTIRVTSENKEISVFEDFELEQVLDDAVIEFEGSINKEGICTYNFIKSDGQQEDGALDLVKSLLTDEIPANRRHFGDEGQLREPVCGPFSFKFYVYDLVKLPRDLRDFIKEHRTYIYRDGIRVYPYGDKDNDWIQLDIYRGIKKAGYYFSNDQIIGYVSITSKDNDKLRDKTNREGLLEEGTAYDDFRLLVLSALNFLHGEYQRYKLKPELRAKRRKERISKLYLQIEKVPIIADRIFDSFNKSENQQDKKLLLELMAAYEHEKEIYKQRIEIVEDLAAVGLAIDGKDHDVGKALENAIENINEIKKMSRAANPDMQLLRTKVRDTEDALTVIRGMMQGILPVFRSARRRRQQVIMRDVVEQVRRAYLRPLKIINSSFNIEEIGHGLVPKTSPGVMYLVITNIVDNAIHWLRAVQTNRREIKVLLDGHRRSMTIADNGSGVNEKDIDYIFEPFFSRKGVEGRGLGLYIARELTDKYDHDLYYIEDDEEKILPGANFRIDFYPQED